METLYLFAFYCGWFFVLISVHEFGHYLFGLLVGIPANIMRIRLLSFPQHVVLRDGEKWISPVKQMDRYIELIWHHLKSAKRVWFYVAGGILLETLFTIVVGLVLLVVGHDKIAWVLVGFSLFLLLPWLVIDTIAILRGRVAGDLSGLWGLARIPTVVLIVASLGLRGAIIWYAII